MRWASMTLLFSKENDSYPEADAEAMGTSPAQASVRFKRGFVRFVYLLFDNIFCGLVFMNHISLASQYIM